MAAEATAPSFPLLHGLLPNRPDSPQRFWLKGSRESGPLQPFACLDFPSHVSQPRLCRKTNRLIAIAGLSDTLPYVMQTWRKYTSVMVWPIFTSHGLISTTNIGYFGSIPQRLPNVSGTYTFQTGLNLLWFLAGKTTCKVTRELSLIL